MECAGPGSGKESAAPSQEVMAMKCGWLSPAPTCQGPCSRSPVPRGLSTRTAPNLGLAPTVVNRFGALPPCQIDDPRGNAVALVAVETTSATTAVRNWLRDYCDEPVSVFDHLAVVSLRVLALRPAERYSYRLPGLHLWPHGFVDEATLGQLRACCEARGVAEIAVETRAVPHDLISLAELEELRLGIHADVAAVDASGDVNQERRNRGRCQRRHNFVSSRAATKNSGMRGPGARPLITGPGMGSDRVFGLEAARRLIRYGNWLMFESGARARYGGHASEISPYDIFAVMEGAAFLLTYDGEEDGTTPTWCRWHRDADNASEPDFQDTLGVCFWGTTPDGRRYRLVCALYTREAVSTWLRVYQPQLCEDEVTSEQREHRALLVKAMEAVARRSWPPRPAASLAELPLYRRASRSTICHRGSNCAPFAFGPMAQWKKYGPVRRAVALVCGQLAVNDAAIALAKDFPSPGSSLLGRGPVEDEEKAAARVLVAICVACQDGRGRGEKWSIPEWAVGASKDGSHSANRHQHTRWMATQSMLNVLRSRLLELGTAEEREEFAMAQLRTLEEALLCISRQTDGLATVCSMLEEDGRSGSKTVVLRNLRSLPRLREITSESCVTSLRAVMTQLGRRDVDCEGELARIRQIGEKAWRKEQRRLCALVSCVRLLGDICGVKPDNGVVLHAIVTSAVVLQAVRVSAQMYDAIVRGGWVRAGSGSCKALLRAGWKVSLRHEQLGSSAHSQVMQRVISGDLITELDGEAEFENWACEGTREMSGDAKSRKLTSLPGFPFLQTQRTVVQGKPSAFLRYDWTAAVEGWQKGDCMLPVFERWAEQYPSMRRKNVWPALWHGL